MSGCLSASSGADFSRPLIGIGRGGDSGRISAKLAPVKNYCFRKTKMAHASQPICKFHQYGYCKFGSPCRHFHTQDTCITENCDKLSCTSRHPRLCLYLTRFGHCKFGTACSYLRSGAVDVSVGKIFRPNSLVSDAGMCHDFSMASPWTGLL